MWTIIYSLRREDADRLEYDNADAWRALLMENAPTLAKSMKISLDNFHWYAAFHDEGHHPHIHMMVWSDDPKEGFLTKDGIAAMRSKLTNAIFRDEMQQIYERKDVAYSDLVEAAQNAMREMISRMQRQTNVLILTLQGNTNYWPAAPYWTTNLGRSLPFTQTWQLVGTYTNTFNDATTTTIIRFNVPTGGMYFYRVLLTRP